MTAIIQSPPAPSPVFVVSWEHHLLVLERLNHLEKEIALVKSLQSEWVSQKEALQITGIKSPDTLKRERERPNTLIVVRKEGETSKQPKYLRVSLIAYCESRIRKPTQPGRNLGD